jgi:predicted alpha/beta hydrolase family esterase
MNASEPTVLIVPGLRDHVPEHWQTHLEKKLRRVRSVPRMDRDSPEKLSCAAWVARLDRSLADFEGPVVLVAHSAGVAIVVHWAQRHARPIRGALLATPPDFESPMPPAYPSLSTLMENGWAPMPRARLAFPSIVAASTNDPLGNLDRVAALAEAWGSEFVNLGAVGHLNPASGFGEWPRAEALLQQSGWMGTS